MTHPRVQQILDFYNSQHTGTQLPEGVNVLNPFTNKEVLRVNRLFYERYYQDDHPRVLILGINPGRFGAGVTGIPFTDPIRLHEVCGIDNNFTPRPELSSEYVYRLIEEYGGTERFYRHFLIGAVSPLGFTRDGKNLNYYDDKNLEKKLRTYILRTMKEQIDLAGSSKVALCLGEGKNYKYLLKLNGRHQFFDDILPLSHPRFIMQYRRKMMEEYLRTQLEALRGAARSLADAGNRIGSNMG